MIQQALRTSSARLDKRMISFMGTYSIRLLCYALAIVFVWFGLLKVIDRSPVADLVAQTVYFIPSGVFVPLLGAWEMAVGLGLLFGFALRLTLLLSWLQMAGTFLVLVLKPSIAFQGGNPALLTTEGEFVIKNLVLIAAGLVIGSTVRSREKGRTRQIPRQPSPV